MKGFRSTDFHHLYQRSVDKGVIFYSEEDRIVYYTAAAIQAKKRNVKVAAAAIMYTHTHQSVMGDSSEDISRYIHDLDSSFSKQYNLRYKRKGRLFQKRLGWSHKHTEKEKRSNIIYVLNNHVEKGLCLHASDYRWSFLAYMNSDHPFSPEIIWRKVSRILLRACRLVDRRVLKSNPLHYADLDRILPKLNSIEKQQFIDYVIYKYSLVNHTLSLNYFGSKEALVYATDSTTGGEYDISEEFSPHKDTAYEKLIKIAEAEGFLQKVYTMSSTEKTEEIIHLHQKYGFNLEQLGKFFHQKISRV